MRHHRKRLRSPITVAWLAITLFPAPNCSAVEQPSGKPNIIVILADDMGYSDISCYGGEIPTPNIDQLANEGVRFSQFYNAARCCPTRASLLTGLYPHQTGVGGMAGQGKDFNLPGYHGQLEDGCATLPEALKTAGYRSYMTGKWHLNCHPMDHGFDRFYGTILGAGSYWSPKSLHRDKQEIDAGKDKAYQPPKYYYTDAIGDHSVIFIKEHLAKSKEQPFFLYTAFTAPHWPMHAPESEIARFKGLYDEGYDAVRKARFERMKTMGLLPAGQKLSPTVGSWDKVGNKEWESRCMETYAAMVSIMDTNIGKIVSCLKEQGVFENTMIFFLSDNGGCSEDMGRAPALASGVLPGETAKTIAYGKDWANVSNTPFRFYKKDTHEGGVATPLIVRGPAVKLAQVSIRHDVGHVIDMMPTCLDLAGGKYPEGVSPMEGRSLLPVFSGESSKPRTIFWEHEGNCAIRVGGWKLVGSALSGNSVWKDNSWQLYNLADDRSESDDLSSQNPEKAKEMIDQFKEYARRTFVIPNPPKLRGLKGD